MASLKDIGLSEESPAEIVLTTFGPNGVPHASTMGAISSGKSKILLRIFTDTSTFKNIDLSRAAVMNVVRDAELLARLALGDLLNKPALSFESSKRVNAPRLRGAGAFVEIEIKNLRTEQISDKLGTSGVAHIEAEVKCIDIQTPGVRAFKRSESFVIQAAVLATKIIEAMRKGKVEIAREIFREIVGYKKKCERIAPGSKDSCVITEIVDSLGRRFGWQG